MKAIVPADSRYVPLTQQRWCCVPTCIQMVMYRHVLPLVPAELLGYHLGLVVPKEEARYFWKVRTAEEPPLAGWGTQIGLTEYNPNEAFKALGIPLRMELRLIDSFTDAGEIKEHLVKAEAEESDVLVCYDNGTFYGTESHGGHVNVFDRFDGERVRLVDPSERHPKWPLVEMDKLYRAMTVHGPEKSGGLWTLSRL